MNFDSYTEQFDRYTTGQMSGKERADFDIQLTENQSLMKAFNFYNVSLDAIESEVERNLRSTLKSWDAEQPVAQSGGTLVSFRRRLMTYGAAASVMLLIGFFALQFFTKPTGEQLFSDYYESDPLSFLRDSGSSNQNLIQPAEEFKAANYDSALEKFASIPESDGNYLMGQYLAGHTAVAMGNFEKAAEFFKIVANSRSPKLAEKGQWNFVLCKVRNYNYSDDFEEMLKLILKKSDHSFIKQAQELNERLEL